MIDYLTHPKFVHYDTSVLPSQQGGGGGMGTKTFRVMEALKDVYPKSRAVCNFDEVTAETILIEPLRFTLPTKPYAKGNDQPVDALLYALHRFEGRKILYCSEMTLLRMPPELREQVLETCDVLTTNCTFQARCFKYVDVFTDYRLCDPIPDVFIPQSDYTTRQARIVATGNVSWQKNAPQLIEIFKALKGVVERVYVGSASLWFDASNQQVPMALQEELYANCDTVIREATTADIASEFHKTKFGVWVAFHDTFATAAQEMIMSGIPVVAAKHGLTSEIPVWAASGVAAQVEAIKRLASEPDKSLAEHSRRLTEWARTHVSYNVFQNQLKTILKALW